MLTLAAPYLSVERLLSRVWAWEPLCIVSDPYRSARIEIKSWPDGSALSSGPEAGGESTSNVQSLRSACYSIPARG